MEFKQAKCPSCGAGLQIPQDRPNWHCGYCGNDFVVTDSLSTAISENKDSLRELARAASDAENYDEAIKIWTKILSNDSKDAEAWFKKGMAELKSVDGVIDKDMLNQIFEAWAKAHLPSDTHQNY